MCVWRTHLAQRRWGTKWWKEKRWEVLGRNYELFVWSNVWSSFWFYSESDWVDNIARRQHAVSHRDGRAEVGVTKEEVTSMRMVIDMSVWSIDGREWDCLQRVRRHLKSITLERQVSENLRENADRENEMQVWGKNREKRKRKWGEVVILYR